MTDRHVGYLVALDKDVRADDAEESVLGALRQIRGVLSVEPIIGGGYEMRIAEQRARRKLQEQMRDVLWSDE